MNYVAADLMDRFASLRVLVVGDAILDSYMEGRAERISREAPVPIVAVDRSMDAPGGAANVAANAASLGATVSFVSVIGDDREGDRLCTLLREHGVDTEHLLVEPG